MYSHYVHAISIVCRSIRSNNGSNRTITAGLYSMFPVELIHQSIIGVRPGARFSPVAATFPRTPLQRLGQVQSSQARIAHA